MTPNKILVLMAVSVLVLMNLHFQLRLSRLQRVFVATIEECGDAWLAAPVARRHKELIEGAG